MILWYYTNDPFTGNKVHDVREQGNSSEDTISHDDIEVISISEENCKCEDRLCKLEEGLLEFRVSKLEDKLDHMMEGISENSVTIERQLDFRLSNLEETNIAVVQQVDDIIKRVNRDNQDKIKRIRF